MASFQERAQHAVSQLDKEVCFQPFVCSAGASPALALSPIFLAA